MSLGQHKTYLTQDLKTGEWLWITMESAGHSGQHNTNLTQALKTDELFT
jgi:hypothetical protein